MLEWGKGGLGEREERVGERGRSWSASERPTADRFGRKHGSDAEITKGPVGCLRNEKGRGRVRRRLEGTKLTQRTTNFTLSDPQSSITSNRTFLSSTSRSPPIASSTTPPPPGSFQQNQHLLSPLRVRHHLLRSNLTTTSLRNDFRQAREADLVLVDPLRPDKEGPSIMAGRYSKQLVKVEIVVG